MNDRANIFSMRASSLLAGGLAGLALALAGSAPVLAADLGVQTSVQTNLHADLQTQDGYWRDGVRAGEIVIYDFEPGVLTRAYWSPPWRNRHYFPLTGKRPRIGREEDLRARAKPKPAEDFYREWSTLRLMLRVIRHSRLPAESTEAAQAGFQAAPPPAVQPRRLAPPGPRATVNLERRIVR
ncbi:MAG: hypothetical protein ACR2K5_14535 [Pseudolabrys sp.]